MGDYMVYITLTRGQAKLLLKLLDAFQVVFGSDVPLQLRGVRNKVFEALYPGERR